MPNKKSFPYIVLIVKFGKLICLVCYALEQLNAQCNQISMSFLMFKTFLLV